MKKIALALACLSIAGTALADESIRLTNNDKSGVMTVETRTCAYSRHDGSLVQCKSNEPLVLVDLTEEGRGHGEHSRLIFIPSMDERTNYSLEVLSVSAVRSAKEYANADYTSGSKVSSCTGEKTADIIVFDSYSTPVVACNAHLYGKAK